MAKKTDANKLGSAHIDSSGGFGTTGFGYVRPEIFQNPQATHDAQLNAEVRHIAGDFENKDGVLQRTGGDTGDCVMTHDTFEKQTNAATTTQEYWQEKLEELKTKTKSNENAISGK